VRPARYAPARATAQPTMESGSTDSSRMRPPRARATTGMR